MAAKETGREAEVVKSSLDWRLSDLPSSPSCPSGSTVVYSGEYIKGATPSTSDQRPSGDDFDQLICVKIGPDEQIFQIYRGVLAFYSGYFRVAIGNIREGRFAEAQSNELVLKAEDPSIFKLFRDWAYARQLPAITLLQHNVLVYGLCRLWIFAECRDIPILMNEVMDRLIEQMIYACCMPMACVKLVYCATRPDSKLRKFFTRLFSCCAPTSKFQGQMLRYWTVESLAEVTLEALNARTHLLRTESTCQLRDWNKCDFHVHEKGVSCEAKVMTERAKKEAKAARASSGSRPSVKLKSTSGSKHVR